MKPIQLSDISRYRSELMGAAIIMIMLFHVPVPRADLFFGLKRMGNIGVDMFLFLSGIGLWFSRAKATATDNMPVPPQMAAKRYRQRIMQFYRRRFQRIYPTWLVVACLYYMPQHLGVTLGHIDWTDMTLDILFNWNFWTRDELAFWYIPTIMALYLLSPYYMTLLQRDRSYQWLAVVPMVWCVIVQYVTPIHDAVGHIEIFWSRVPIFFLGINCGEAIRRRETLSPSVLPLIAVLFAMAFGTSLWLEQIKHGLFPLFLERMLYIPFAVTLIILLAMAFRRSPRWILTAMAFCGGISLEIYLIHVQFILNKIIPLHIHYWPTFLLTLVITLPAAKLLQKLVQLITGQLYSRHTGTGKKQS